MKFIAVLSFLFLAVAGTSAHSLDKHVEVVTALLKECQTREGGDDADFESLIAQKSTGSRASNCMISCAFEKIGMVSRRQPLVDSKLIFLVPQKVKDGKLDKSVFMLMAKILVGSDEKLLVAAEEIVDECAPSMDTSDRCDDAYKFENCLHSAVKSRNLKVGNLF